MSIARTIIEDATGLHPDEFHLSAFADHIMGAQAAQDKPAVLAGTYRGANTAVRAWPRVIENEGKVTRWDAIAFISQHPALALDQLSVEERERLRAVSQTPQGADEPVGQEAVLNQPPPAPSPDPKPYAPPVQTLGELLPDDEGVRVEQAACGTEGCMTAIHPTEGTQTVHVEGCPEFTG